MDQGLGGGRESLEQEFALGRKRTELFNGSASPVPGRSGLPRYARKQVWALQMFQISKLLEAQTDSQVKIILY